MAIKRLRVVEPALGEEPPAGRRQRNWTDDDEEPISDQTPSSDQIVAAINALEKDIRTYFHRTTDWSKERKKVRDKICKQLDDMRRAVKIDHYRMTVEGGYH